MNLFGKVLLSVAILLLTPMGCGIVASELGEVVVLQSRKPDGDTKRTRLWVVDIDGSQYLRASPDSDWYLFLQNAPEASLTRADATQTYRAEPQMAQAQELNRLMREKYGWRDAYSEFLFGGREDAVPVALVPAPSRGRASP